MYARGSPFFQRVWGQKHIFPAQFSELRRLARLVLARSAIRQAGGRRMPIQRAMFQNAPLELCRFLRVTLFRKKNNSDRDP